jgi:quercetin dioxygenase-like cupin family protein
MTRARVPDTFLPAGKRRWARLGWGDLAWLSGPDGIASRDLVVAEVRLAPGGFHGFHLHPRQEEVIHVLEGKVEQWLRRERRILRAGDAVFIPRRTVHATFNAAKGITRLLVVLGPPVGKGGYELVDMSGRAPWKGLRRAR